MTLYKDLKQIKKDMALTALDIAEIMADSGALKHAVALIDYASRLIENEEECPICIEAKSKNLKEIIREMKRLIANA